MLGNMHASKKLAMSYARDAMKRQFGVLGAKSRISSSLVDFEPRAQKTLALRLFSSFAVQFPYEASSLLRLLMCTYFIYQHFPLTLI